MRCLNNCRIASDYKNFNPQNYILPSTYYKYVADNLSALTIYCNFKFSGPKNIDLLTIYGFKELLINVSINDSLKQVEVNVTYEDKYYNFYSHQNSYESGDQNHSLLISFNINLAANHIYMDNKNITAGHSGNMEGFILEDGPFSVVPLRILKKMTLNQYFLLNTYYLQLNKYSNFKKPSLRRQFTSTFNRTNINLTKMKSNLNFIIKDNKLINLGNLKKETVTIGY